MTQQQIEKAANAYIGHDPEFDEGVHVHAERLAFINGARWRINSVWHDKEEIPQKGRRCLVELTMRSGHKVYRLWNGNWDNPYLTKWAYVADLLPDGKEDR